MTHLIACLLMLLGAVVVMGWKGKSMTRLDRYHEASRACDKAWSAYQYATLLTRAGKYAEYEKRVAERNDAFYAMGVPMEEESEMEQLRRTR